MYNDLIGQLQNWREEGSGSYYVWMETRTFTRRAFGKSITARYGLDINEVVGTFTGKKIGATFFRGSKLIDSVRATPDIIVS